MRIKHGTVLIAEKILNKMRPSFNIILKIGLATALIIILSQVAGLLFIYKYFKFDYYISAVAVVFLIAGIIITKYNAGDKTPAAPESDLFNELTGKELYILQLITEGKSNKEIAAINFVEVSTIKTHINNIYTKLGLSNRKQAIIGYKSRFGNQTNLNIHPFST